jgi:hypothetical protein
MSPTVDVKSANQISTSTSEAEYTALSIALRAAIPLLEVIRFVVSAIPIKTCSWLRFKTTVPVDNQRGMKVGQSCAWMSNSSFQVLCYLVPLVSFPFETKCNRDRLHGFLLTNG